jgi:hypothetical protein
LQGLECFADVIEQRLLKLRQLVRAPFCAASSPASMVLRKFSMACRRLTNCAKVRIVAVAGFFKAALPQ